MTTAGGTNNGAPAGTGLTEGGERGEGAGEEDAAATAAEAEAAAGEADMQIPKREQLGCALCWIFLV